MGCRPGLRKSAFILIVAFLFGSTALSSVTWSHALFAERGSEFLRSGGDPGFFATAERSRTDRTPVSVGPFVAREQGSAAEAVGTKPSMGWNSWNRFGSDGLNEVLVRETADAMVSSGMLAAGYDIVALDDGWSADARDGSGNLTNDPVKFPSGMKALGDYIHARGLRYGIYASIGTATCTGHDPGSLDHEFQDVATFASWGVDYIKADRCDASGLVMKDIYARWRDAIIASGRSIVLSASDNSPTDEPWAWGPVTAHQWRVSPDISDDWTSPPNQPPWKEGMIDIFDRNAAHAAATAPGTFNDPDMLEVGNGGMTDDEYRTHFGLWALMSAPLIAGNDVRNMRAEIQEILTHPEVIAVDQDPLAFQAIKASDDGAGLQVWYKPLSGSGVRAVGLLNRGTAAATITVTWTAIGLAPGSATVRDLWARADRGTFTNGYSVSVPSHGLALLRIAGTDPTATDGYVSDLPWTYMANELGSVERDSSNGDAGAGDGHPLRLDGVDYAKGLGAAAPSAIEFRLNGVCSTFTADLGIDDEVGSKGSVIFQIWGDGQKLYDSGVRTGDAATTSVDVSVSGRDSLRLEVVAVDSADSDHADWANARVTCPGAPPPNQPPRAAFATTAAQVRPGDFVTFDASASTDPDGVIVSFRWAFGDGLAGEGRVISHAYAYSGRFLVVLTVVDNDGTSAGTATEITVNIPPMASFAASPEAAFPGVLIRFNASASTDIGGSIVAYEWDFGDGRIAEGVSVGHVYAANGTFTVHLVVTDDLGATGEMVKAVEIGNRRPAIVSASPGPGVVLDPWTNQTFVVVASDPDGDPLTYLWTVDDTAVGSSSPKYEFVRDRPGTYVVRVVVSDGTASVDFAWSVAVRVRASSPSVEFVSFLVIIACVAAGFAAVEIAHRRRRHR